MRVHGALAGGHKPQTGLSAAKFFVEAILRTHFGQKVTIKPFKEKVLIFN